MCVLDRVLAGVEWLITKIIKTDDGDDDDDDHSDGVYDK